MLPTRLSRRSFFASLLGALPACVLARRVPADAAKPPTMPLRPSAEPCRGEWPGGTTTYVYDVSDCVRPGQTTINFYDAQGRLLRTESRARVRDAGDWLAQVPRTRSADRPTTGGAQKPSGSDADSLPE